MWFMCTVGRFGGGESAPCKGVGEQIPTRFSCFFPWVKKYTMKNTLGIRTIYCNVCSFFVSLFLSFFLSFFLSQYMSDELVIGMEAGISCWFGILLIYYWSYEHCASIHIIHVSRWFYIHGQIINIHRSIRRKRCVSWLFSSVITDEFWNVRFILCIIVSITTVGYGYGCCCFCCGWLLLLLFMFD